MLKSYMGGRKHSRAVQSYYIFPELSNEIRKFLAMLDLYIDFLDDMYDEVLTKEQKLLLLTTFSVTQSYVYSWIKENGMDMVIDSLARYMTMPVYVALSQSRRDVDLVWWYYWRSSVMDIFMEIPAKVLGLQKEDVDKLIDIGRWLRSIILVWKDLHDLQHDRNTNAENPFLSSEHTNVSVILSQLADKLYISLDKVKNSDIKNRIMDIMTYYTSSIAKY